jgi:toxin ParE1/3/4
VAGIHLAPEVFEDFDRIFEHLATASAGDAAARVREIVEALQILSHSPRIGRPVKGGKRELIIGQGSHGYVALYRYIADIDSVFVLAVRHQPESGYR